ncbi:Non-structural maintenance of chromosome element 4 [Grifola frondosa]|uniref:Non-structural maintenance of chromosomes element 4 n=1 Tax=Grifola frondosa TaxID=5627 RepID=A0A1C7M8W8_GRIFR|nr:Non-structural maintenance of chromosome element 4 [Grifola frondosa]
MVSRDVDMEEGPSQGHVELGYDPDQPAEETRDIRRQYRSIQREMEEKNANEVSADQIVDTVRRADHLFARVKGIGEATRDSNLLLKATQWGAAKARAMKSGSGGFDVDDFVARLITFMGGRRDVSIADDSDAEEYEDDYAGGPLDWERIGRRALAKSRRVPAMDFMLGPLSIEQKKRAVVKRAKLEVNKADMKKPQQITEDDITRSENETTKNVAALRKLLTQQEDPINLFRFIVNPNDFGQSVENLFYLSFLIRDGICAFDTTKEGEPVIYICEPPSAEDYDGGLKKRQVVMEFDMATWQRAIEVFDIRESMIPQRPKSEMRIGGKWYG